MSKLQKMMIKMAKKQHKKIFPCGGRKTLKECFTQQEDITIFWYNTDDKTTKIMAINKNDLKKTRNKEVFA